MRKLMSLMVAVAGLAVVAPNVVSAQGRSHKVTAGTVVRRTGDSRYDDRDSDRAKSERKREEERLKAERKLQEERWKAERRRLEERQRLEREAYNDRMRNDRDYNRNDRNYDRDYNQGNNRKNGNGPAFCRSGAGHPVYGRQWCYDKGYGVGGTNSRWDRVRWDDVIFRSPRRSNLEMGRDVLIGVLGGSVYNRLDSQRQLFGIHAPMTGRWTEYDNRSVLLVSAGGFPLAELVDLNGDRRVDTVLLNRR